ncbi:conserved hypothetical protein [Cyanobium sp. PCC 7001]|uniref:AAA family ATPase n=1 Tax=Cyanobium sp. PCC 7001 TaxID=180281 RepID=UPI0001805BDC|nr:AAA family ATPase [Cyanobium sp. PCC 7001]EDY37577.1 conserved hypothetical protein [Cyanobium sp. PCC 7001]
MTYATPNHANGRVESSSQQGVAPKQPGVFDPPLAAEFIDAIGKNGCTRTRGFRPKGQSRGRAVKDDLFLPDGSVNAATIQRWQDERFGVYFVVNNGGDTKASITEIVAYFAEFDDGTKTEQFQRLNSSPLLTPSYVIDNGGKSLHVYWVLDEPILCRAREDCPNKAQWTAEQERIAAVLGSDPSIKDPSRVMRLPGAWYVKADGSFGGQAKVVAGTGKRVMRDEFLDCLPEPESPVSPPPRQLQASPAPISADLPPRPLEEVRAALNYIPPRIPGSGTYQDDRPAAIGYIHAVIEAGGTKELAMADLRVHNPEWTDNDQVIRSSDLSSFTSGSFWHAVKVNGGDASRSDLCSNGKQLASRIATNGKVMVSPAQGKAGSQKPPEEVLIILRDRARKLIQQPMPPHERSVILRSLAQNHGAHITPAEISQLLSVARQDLRGRPQGVALGQKICIQRRKWLCEGLLPAGRPTLMVSVPKVGKTTLLCALVSAWHYGCGEFLGMKLHGNCPPVLLLGPDMTPEDWADLLVPLGLARYTKEDEDDDNRELELLPPIQYLWHSESGITLNEEGYEEVEEQLRENQGSLLIADSYTALTASLGLDEWKAEVAGPLLDLACLCSLYDATPIVIHHAGKSRAGERASSASRGANALPAAVSQVVSLRWLDEAGPGSIRRDSRVVLSTEGRAGKPVELVVEQQEDRQWVLHGEGAQFEAEKARQRQIEKINKNERQRAVYELVRGRWDQGLRTGVSDILNELGDLFEGGDQQKMARRTLEQLDLTHGLIEQKKEVVVGRGLVALYQVKECGTNRG